MIGVSLFQGASLVSGAEAAVSYPGVIFRPLDDDAPPYRVIWSEHYDNPILRRFMSLARRWSRQRIAQISLLDVHGARRGPSAAANQEGAG